MPKSKSPRIDPAEPDTQASLTFADVSSLFPHFSIPFYGRDIGTPDLKKQVGVVFGCPPRRIPGYSCNNSPGVLGLKK